MADSAYQAFVEVLPDFSNFNTAATRQMSSALGTAGVAGGQAMNGGILASVPKLAGPLVAAVAALGIGRLIGETIGNGIRFGLDGIDLASDLNESFNATKVTFGAEVSAQITALGSDAATRLGLTSRAFNEIATQFSAFASTVRSENPASFIDELTTRGADFASVYNLEVNDALSLFQSGLAGETEPLRKFGLDLSAASVEAFAYANGIGVVGRELTEAEKVQARYGLLMAQTAATQGDFANTSDDLANQQRILAASYEEAQTKLGTALLPTMLLFTQLANDTLIPLLNDVVEKVGPQLATALTDAAPAFVELVEAVAPLIPDLVTLSVELLPPLLQLLTLWAEYTGGIVGYVSALIDLLQGDSTFSEYQNEVAGLTGAFGDVIRVTNAVGQWLAQFVADTAANLGRFVETARAGVAGFVGFFASLPGNVLASVGDLGNLLYSSGRSLIQGFINGINAMLQPIRNAVNGVMSTVSGFFPRSPAKYGPFSGAGWASVQKSGRALFEQFDSGFDGELGSRVSLSGLSVPVGTVSNGGGALSSSGSFINNGTIQVTDEKALVAEVEARKRRANALAGIGAGLVA